MRHRKSLWEVDHETASPQVLVRHLYEGSPQPGLGLYKGQPDRALAHIRDSLEPPSLYNHYAAHRRVRWPVGAILAVIPRAKPAFAPLETEEGPR